jgi:hypothetical protein
MSSRASVCAATSSRGSCGRRAARAATSCECRLAVKAADSACPAWVGGWRKGRRCWSTTRAPDAGPPARTSCARGVDLGAAIGVDLGGEVRELGVAIVVGAVQRRTARRATIKLWSTTIPSFHCFARLNTPSSVRVLIRNATRCALFRRSSRVRSRTISSDSRWLLQTARMPPPKSPETAKATENSSRRLTLLFGIFALSQGLIRHLPNFSPSWDRAGDRAGWAPPAVARSRLGFLRSSPESSADGRRPGRGDRCRPADADRCAQVDRQSPRVQCIHAS